MPIHACTLPDGKQGYQWGQHGKCYASRKDAEAQATAIYASGWYEKLLSKLKKGDVQGHEFHGNQWTDNGGAEHTAKTIGFDKSPWDFSTYKNAPDLRRDIVDVKDAKAIRNDLKEQGRLNSDGRTVSLYHVTMNEPADIKNILDKGLIPGAQPAPGQSFKAMHSDYATYFHGDLNAALANVEQSGKDEHGNNYATIIEARIPVTPKSLIRVLPDEDVSLNIHGGAKALLNGEAVAYIGGVPPSNVRVYEPVKKINLRSLLLKQQDLDHAAHDAATSPHNLKRPPTEAQAQAGNYPKGHVRFAGLDVSIENPAGSKRRPEWPPMQAHYGYVRGTEGADGDQVDCFLRPATPLDWDGEAYVIDQVGEDGAFDEHKIMIGWDDEDSAVKAYLAHYPAGWKLGPVTAMSLDELRDWLSGDTTQAIVKGDLPGHEFHGNQWTGGGEYQIAGDKVDGRTVLNDVPNTSSIEASLDDPEVLPGIREIPMSAFDPSYKPKPYSVSESNRLNTLTAAIKASNEISPLIVAIDEQGPYILEGGHRFDALMNLGAKSFPAMVAVDKASAGDDPAKWNWKYAPVQKIYLRSLLFKEDGGGAPATTTTTGHVQSSSPTSGLTAYGMIRREKKRIRILPQESRA